MSHGRNIWYVRTAPWPPRTWRQWLATLAFGVFVAAMIFLAIAIAATFFVIIAIVAIVLAAYVYLSMLFGRRRARPERMRDVTPYRDQFDA